MMNPHVKESCIQQLDRLFTTSENKGVIILYKGRQLIMHSGKRIWSSKQHASSALANALSISPWRLREFGVTGKDCERLAAQLETEGIIKIKTLE